LNTTWVKAFLNGKGATAAVVVQMPIDSA